MANPSQVFDSNGNAVFEAINFDAGGRQRASLMTTLFDGKTLTIDDANIWENVGTGTAAMTSGIMNLAVTSGQYIVRRSRTYTPYFSGKSTCIEMTFDNFQTVANLTKRAGYFSSNAAATYDTNKDGFWLEDDGVTKTLNIQNNGTSLLSLPISKWDNYEKIKNYDWSKFTVIFFDYLWLGGTALRFFLEVEGQFVLVHTHKHAGRVSGPFIKSPNQTVRYELRSSTGVGNFNAICSQVATEGSLDESGKPVALINAASITCNTIGTIYALKGVKKVSTYRDTAVQITDFSIASTQSNTAGILMLIKNPTLSVALTYVARSKISDGSPTTAGSPPTITADTGQILSAVSVGQGGSGRELTKSFLNFLSISLADVADEYIVAFMPTVSTQTLNAVLVIKEF